MFPKHDFFHVLGYFGHFSFFGLRGGAKIFGRVAKGGENFDVSLRGGEKFWTTNCFGILRDQ